jgi:nucleotide-binding universal stress UspA family protein
VGTIFVGSRGLGAIKRFLLGSFSNYIVTHASQNVMVVKE